MIVTILDGRVVASVIGPPVVGSPVVGSRRGVVVAVLGRPLVAVLVRSVLCVKTRWAYSRQRERDDNQYEWIPKGVMHGGGTLLQEVSGSELMLSPQIRRRDGRRCAPPRKPPGSREACAWRMPSAPIIHQHDEVSPLSQACTRRGQIAL